MFINWAHFIIPKITFILSFIANPVFVYLIRTEKVIQFGDYRYLLYFFAIFNLTASVVDILIPACVYSYRYAAVFFIVDSVFSERSNFAPTLISLRCAFIAGTYGILNIHFIFRYNVLKNTSFVSHYFMPYGLILSIFLVIFHIGLWTFVVEPTMYSSDESRNYVRQAFQEEYGVDVNTISTKIAVYAEASSGIVFRAWIGTGVVTVIASYSMTLYFVLGYKIMSGLNQGSATMSLKTAQMQKRLFWALTIQTIIPICVSFMPVTLVLYGSAFCIDFPNWINWGSATAISFFPFLDPLAIIMCLPALRQRLGRKIGIRPSQVQVSSNQINTIDG
ncbi:Serpentine Receptor, class J [Caenorhabditis elegans]|uniref:Serpentine Receptor, class J n=1 Tax=Caenorhabditis elegans TaxID=6239 RepID=Q9N5F9_CAEEL|nr:Serpentine Receptor, class J [Caenorhabditis elegans]CCD65486.1 Serpentine Receptor, class J [Caenorhabditis elegans]|eukprot:NP_503756.2 Serpentine Receptor, class J [Caenorhabditis elegans]